jgi:acyl-CoA thioester hydrolase
MGVVYYANYLVWFEVGRALPVIEVQCEYRQPARYDDEIDIATKGTLVTPVRVRFDYELTRAVDDAAIAGGHTVHAAIDSSGRPCRLPARVRELFP